MLTYLRPASVAEAVEILHDHSDVRVLAGGTDLLVAFRNAPPCGTVLDIKGIPALNALEMCESGLSVGAAVTLNRLIDAGAEDDCYQLLKDAALQLGNHLLRNRATLAGNLCTASPVSDMAGACLVLGGFVEAVSREGARRIPLGDFFTGVKTNALRPNELATKIVLARREGRGLYLKRKRVRGHDLAQVGVTAFRSGDGVLDIALASVAPTPVLFPGVVKAGEAPELQKILKTILGGIAPISDVRSSKEYRLGMAEAFIGQAVDRLY